MPGKANSSDNEQELDELMTLEEAPNGALAAGFVGVVTPRLRGCDEGHDRTWCEADALGAAARTLARGCK